MKILNEEEKDIKYNTLNTLSEKKILNMINFNYNNYEINNDLLFNICQGFIDINKLKEENLSTLEKSENGTVE